MNDNCAVQQAKMVTVYFTDPVDIQTILNGAAKFCYHCDVVILSNGIRKKASEVRSSKSNELPSNNSENDDVYFCSSTCFMQSALMHRSPSISHEKVRFYLVIAFI